MQQFNFSKNVEHWKQRFKKQKHQKHEMLSYGSFNENSEVAFWVRILNKKVKVGKEVVFSMSTIVFFYDKLTIVEVWNSKE